jgi:hypothetical protein
MVKIISLALLAIGGFLYRSRQRRNRDYIDIPIFLRGGNYPLHNGPGCEIIDPVEVYPVTSKIKKRNWPIFLQSEPGRYQPAQTEPMVSQPRGERTRSYGVNCSGGIKSMLSAERE